MPKGKDIGEYSEKEIKRIEHYINNSQNSCRCTCKNSIQQINDCIVKDYLKKLVILIYNLHNLQISFFLLAFIVLIYYNI